MPSNVKPSQISVDRVARTEEAGFPVWQLGHAPTVEELPEGHWAIVDNGTQVRLYYRRNDTIKFLRPP